MAAAARPRPGGLRPRSAAAVAAAVGLTLGASGCALLNANRLPDGPVRISLTEHSGRVLVIRDTAYVVAQPGIEVAAGDRVATMARASAVLNYTALDEQGAETDASCQVTVPANAVLTVTGSNDCASPDLATRVSTEEGDLAIPDSG